MSQDFDTSVAFQELRFLISWVGRCAGGVRHDQEAGSGIGLPELLELLGVRWVDGVLFGDGEAVVLVQDYGTNVGSLLATAATPKGLGERDRQLVKAGDLVVRETQCRAEEEAEGIEGA